MVAPKYNGPILVPFASLPTNRARSASFSNPVSPDLANWWGPGLSEILILAIPRQRCTSEIYHDPRNYYVNNSQGNNSLNCVCNLAAKIILKEIIYVIVIDTLYNGKQRHMQKLFLSTIGYVIVIVTCHQK